MRSAIALVACVGVLAVVDWSIVQREHHLESGRIVYLELAPVDPRSLMQGDYMALSFAIAREAQAALREARQAEDGRIVVTVGSDGVAKYARMDDGRPLAADELRLRYRIRAGEMKFATNAWFFEEGTAARYEPARYGEFRVDPDGELLLTRMRGKDLQPL
ncbi:MAG TPA: GDYXXLXY domain-containing protein [Burkholderiales bacterium]|nr:GDYXXLXY domain-containing protein [Burkholderiales bacterium]